MCKELEKKKENILFLLWKCVDSCGMFCIFEEYHFSWRDIWLPSTIYATWDTASNFYHSSAMGKSEQAGAELGQAQLKPGLGFTSINLLNIHNQEMSLARLTTTNH